MIRTSIALLTLPQAAALLAFVLAPGAVAQTTHYDVLGAVASGHLGQVVARVGDVDRDGADDFVVGAPEDDLFGLGAGLARVISGRDGTELFTFLPTVSPAHHGAAVDGAGDVDGDGWPDILVGSPWVSGRAGQATVYSGRDGSPLHTLDGMQALGYLGAAVAGVGFLDGDAFPDFLVGAPGEDAVSSGDRRGVVRAFSGATGQELYRVEGTIDQNSFGRTLAGIGDVDGDGRDDWAATAYNDIDPTDSYVAVISGATGTELYRTFGLTINQYYGQSLAGVGDTNGDGVPDYMVGIPAFDCGHCQLLGRAELLSGVDGSVLIDFPEPSGRPGYGHAVAGLGDLDLDGRPDVAISQPGIPDAFILPGKTVFVYSGATGQQLFQFDGDGGNDRFGWSLAGADTDGDGQRELVVGAPYAPGAAGTIEGGLARVVGLPVPPPTPYCTSKTNSQGCVPAIGSVGTPSVTGGPFDVTCSQVINNKVGLLFYGYAPKASAYQGGFLCVQAPVKRTAVQNSNGNPPPDDCSGFYSYDFAGRILSGVDPALQLGAVVYAQYWFRDPSDPSGFATGRSDGLKFRIRP